MCQLERLNELSIAQPDKKREIYIYIYHALVVSFNRDPNEF
jgi:hypothetical protein